MLVHAHAMQVSVLVLVGALSLVHAAGGRKPVDPVLVTLYDGKKMPLLGLGIGNLPHNEIVPAVKEAVSLGIRLIDTAAASKNEHILKQALQASKGNAAHTQSTTFSKIIQ